MNKVLCCAGAYANTHQDDIIITSDSWEAHLSHIRGVLERLRLVNLHARATKMQFTREKTKCLEFVMEKGKIVTDHNKVKTIDNFQDCTSKKSVLRVTSYYVDTLKIIVSAYFFSPN